MRPNLCVPCFVQKTIVPKFCVCDSRVQEHLFYRVFLFTRHELENIQFLVCGSLVKKKLVLYRFCSIDFFLKHPIFLFAEVLFETIDN